jgi:hypothetical protein
MVARDATPGGVDHFSPYLPSEGSDQRRPSTEEGGGARGAGRQFARGEHLDEARGVVRTAGRWEAHTSSTRKSRVS